MDEDLYCIGFGVVFHGPWGRDTQSNRYGKKGWENNNVTI